MVEYIKDRAKTMGQNTEIIRNLIKLIENSSVYDLDSYKYFVFPFKGIFPIDVKLLRKIINLTRLNISPDSNKIFTFMVDGLVLALPIALEMNRPLVIARDFHYNLSDVTSFLQETNYYKRKMYFKGLVKSDKVEIIDAIVSSGKTILSAIDKIEKIILSEMIYKGIQKKIQKILLSLQSKDGKDFLILD